MDYIIYLFIVYRYDSITGTFTVPSGGDGFYYFSSFLTADGGESGYFNVELNGDLICTLTNDLTTSSTTDSEATSCSGVAYVTEGTTKMDIVEYFTIC